MNGESAKAEMPHGRSNAEPVPIIHPSLPSAIKRLDPRGAKVFLYSRSHPSAATYCDVRKITTRQLLVAYGAGGENGPSSFLVSSN
jgi:hypothetical protein